MHVMLDLETTGLRATSAILTVGMVWFDPRSDDAFTNEDDRLHIKLDHEWQLENGFTIDESTTEWWRQQSEKAQRAAWEGEGTNVFLAAGMIKGFLSRHPLDGVWGNGAAFDNALMRHFFEVVSNTDGLTPNNREMMQWSSYKQDMCYRTLRRMYADSWHNEKVDLPEFQGTEHNALDDAVYQARCAQVMMQEFNLFQH